MEIHSVLEGLLIMNFNDSKMKVGKWSLFLIASILTSLIIFGIVSLMFKGILIILPGWNSTVYTHQQIIILLTGGILLNTVIAFLLYRLFLKLLTSIFKK